MFSASPTDTWQKKSKEWKDTKDIEKEKSYFISFQLCYVCVWIPRWVKRIVIYKCVKKETTIPHTNYSAHESLRL